MNGLVVFIAIFGLAAANPQFFSGISASQYRYQDELGQHAFGHVGGPNSREEVKTADGITRGSYSYVDAHGLVQSAVYTADDYNGFRVAATNLPVGPAVPAGPAVVAAPAVANIAYHGVPVVHALKKRDLVAVSQPLTSYPGSTSPLAHAVHAPVVAAPVAYSAHVVAPVAYAAPVAYSAHVAAPVYSHVLKKRAAVFAAPYAVAAPYHTIHPGALPVPADTPVVAHAKAAQLIQQNTEAIRNTFGGVPLALPADTPEVAAGKIAHSIAHANQAAAVSPVVAAPFAHPAVLY